MTANPDAQRPAKSTEAFSRHVLLPCYPAECPLAALRPHGASCSPEYGQVRRKVRASYLRGEVSWIRRGDRAGYGWGSAHDSNGASGRGSMRWPQN